MSKPILFFDFDGVIVHSMDMWLKMAQRDYPALTAQDFINNSMGNVHEEFAKYAELHGHKVTSIREHQDQNDLEIRNGLLKQRMVTGIDVAIREVQERFQLFIVTSGRKAPVKAYLEQQNLLDAFEDVYASDDDISKYKKIQMIFERTGCVSDRCLFITDTLGDLREAARANVAGIGVSWGLHDKVDLRKGDPIAMVDSVEELVGVIQKHFS